MGKFTSLGPDWTDIQILLKEIEQAHAVRVNLQMSLGGDRAVGYLEIIALATTQKHTGGVLPASVSRKMWFPNQQAKTMEGAITVLLWALNDDCLEFWQQQVLPQ